MGYKKSEDTFLTEAQKISGKYETYLRSTHSFH